MPPGNVHILGIGNLGKLIAHSLRKYQPETKVTLLFHRQSLDKEWKDASEVIEIVRNGVSDKQHGIHHEFVSEANSPIEHLVVATKTYATVEALAPLRRRLSDKSSLLFVQNGIGTIDEVSHNVFNQVSTRPRYLAGIVSHGLFSNSQFSSTHAGFADMIIGPVLSGGNEAQNTNAEEDSGSTAFLEQQLLGCPSLNARLVSSKSLLLAQMRKLVVNAVINPLTSIFDRRNGEIFESAEFCKLIQALIAEISDVLLAEVKARVGDSAEDLDRVSKSELETLVFEVGAKTAQNISSMRQDVLAGRKTEIDYMNGWVVSQGAVYDISCPLNTRIVELIRTKIKLQNSDIQTTFDTV